MYLKPEKYTTVLNIRAFGNLKGNLKVGSIDFIWDSNISEHFLGTFAKSRKATISFIMSVRPYRWNNSANTGRIFTKFDIWEISKICRENSILIKIGQE
jgi:hypothetical protein